jgi:hypothetical protein
MHYFAQKTTSIYVLIYAIFSFPQISLFHILPQFEQI